MSFHGGYEVELIPGEDHMNQLILRASRQLAEEEQKQILTLLSKAWNEGFDSCRDQFDRQRTDPRHPIGRPDPYAAMLRSFR